MIKRILDWLGTSGATMAWVIWCAFGALVTSIEGEWTIASLLILLAFAHSEIYAYQIKAEAKDDPL